DRRSLTSASRSPAPTCTFHDTTASDPVRISDRCPPPIRAGGPTPAHQRSIEACSLSGEARTHCTSTPAFARHVASATPEVGGALPTNSSTMTMSPASALFTLILSLVRDLYCAAS